MKSEMTTVGKSFRPDQPSLSPNKNMSEQVQCNCAWNQETWTNTADYQFIQCGGCHRIKEFRFKSFWKRFKDLFINSTLAIGLLAITACRPSVDLSEPAPSRDPTFWDTGVYNAGEIGEVTIKEHQFLVTRDFILHAPYCPCGSKTKF